MSVYVKNNGIKQWENNMGSGNPHAYWVSECQLWGNVEKVTQNFIFLKFSIAQTLATQPFQKNTMGKNHIFLRKIAVIQ